jgi:hypothetical protein
MMFVKFMRFKLLRWFNGLMVDRHFIGLIISDTSAGLLTGVVPDLIGMKSNPASNI